MSPFEKYIQALKEIHATGAGTKETSYYTPLQNLLDAIGSELKPKVCCVMQLKNQGAGMPDGGLFSGKQKDSQNPERGVIEVKGTRDDVNKISATPQVSKYWKKYAQVLVTNYRDFVLIGKDVNGQALTLEAYQLAESEKDFWQKAQKPHIFAKEHEEQITEYLKRVMLQKAMITSPKDLAWFLASYAKDARARIDKSDLPALQSIKKALEESLGISFKGDKKDPEKGDHFFKSTLIQTLFYGIFSAWVLWHKQGAKGGYFNWQVAQWSLHVPMVQALFVKVATPSNLGRLELVEVLEWTGGVLNRVDREAFFSDFDEGQAVQYFYEPFLEAFDPQLRKELGVWYTPPEIVKYMVARVDMVLREELDIADGLADPNVYVLDPCCGTGAYLVEVLRCIANTLEEKGSGALTMAQLKDAAINRIFGFEILTAPFIVAHLQLGLFLANLGLPLKEDNERVGVFLTNALTGWRPPNEDAKRRIQQLELNFPELNAEREAADKVKQGKPILVVLGNPPYNGYAGVSPDEEEGLVEIYKEDLAEKWGITNNNLDDLYVRFLRLAERCITAQTGRGIVCYITNFSFLKDPSFVVMRQKLLSDFDKIYIDCMNGDSRETGKRTPDGKPDPSAFKTVLNSAGIKKGTTISLMIRQKNRDLDSPQVNFRHFWGKNKNKDLLNSLPKNNFDDQYILVDVHQKNRFCFRPISVSENYFDWVLLTDLPARDPFNGPIERRGNTLIVFKGNQNQLELLSQYLDPQIGDQEITNMIPRWMTSSGEFDAKDTRKNLISSKIQYQNDKIKTYPFKPFDIRLAYLDKEISPLFSRPSPELLEIANIPNNSFFLSRDTADSIFEKIPFYFSSSVCDYDTISGHARHFPMFIQENINRKIDGNNEKLFDVNLFTSTIVKANLSKKSRFYLRNIGCEDPDVNLLIAPIIWHHALAIGYSTNYLDENFDGIQENFPRIPLPNSKKLLLHSAQLGETIAKLLNTEEEVIGVTTKIRPELKNIAVISRVGGGQLNPDTDLALTAGWGHLSGNATMPGRGKIIETPDGKAYDIYLNDIAYWKNIPKPVWKYIIGGYQVIKKWLSYREEPLLSRPLKIEEIQEVTNMARRIAAIIALEPELNTNYQAVKANTYPWHQD